MNPPRIVILGAGGHARVVIEALRLSGGAEIIAALDADPATHGTLVLGTTVSGGDDALARLASEGATHFVVAVGSVGRTRMRAKLFALGLDAGLQPLAVRHPTANCSPSATVGDGAQLLAGCIVNTLAKVGANAIVNCGAIVEHDCVIGAHTHVASGACLSGGVRIGDEAHVGAGATVIQSVRIGRGAVIGAGAVVLKDVADNDTVAGVPARSIQKK